MGSVLERFLILRCCLFLFFSVFHMKLNQLSFHIKTGLYTVVSNIYICMYVCIGIPAQFTIFQVFYIHKHFHYLYQQ